jgi:hypothetical protein
VGTLQMQGRLSRTHVVAQAGGQRTNGASVKVTGSRPILDGSGSLQGLDMQASSVIRTVRGPPTSMPTTRLKLFSGSANQVRRHGQPIPVLPGHTCAGLFVRGESGSN